MRDLTDVLSRGILDRSRYTSHWRWMRDDPAAIRQKERRCRYVADQIGAPGKRIVDFGSGTGLLACYLATVGASDVIGVEILPQHLEFAEKLKEAFGLENVRFCNVLDVEQSSVDAIILANVITHIYRPFDLLARMRDALKPGGVLFIEDNNNAASPFVRRGLPKVWAEVEAEYRTAREGGDKTYGMTADQARFWADRADCPDLHGHAALDPETVIYHENAFDPRHLADALFHLGFASRSVGPKHVFDFKTNEPVSAAFLAFPRLALRVSPAYELVAVRI